MLQQGSSKEIPKNYIPTIYEIQINKTVPPPREKKKHFLVSNITRETTSSQYVDTSGTLKTVDTTCVKYLYVKPERVILPYPPFPNLIQTDEDILINWIIILSKSKYSFTNDTLKTIVSKIVPGNQHVLSSLDSWCQKIFDLYPELAVKLDIPEVTANQRWFDSLKNYLTENQCIDVLVDSSRKFVIEEMGVWFHAYTDTYLGLQGETLKYLRPIDCKELGTAVFCVNTDGNICPTQVVLKYGNVPNDVLERIPENIIFSHNDVGTQSGRTFMKLLQEFVQNAQLNNVTFPILLIIDDQLNNISIEVLRYCVENKILLFPKNPQTNNLHELFQNQWRTYFQHYKKENKILTFIKAKFGMMIQDSMSTISKDEVIEIFRCSGIHPFDPEVIDLHNMSTNVATQLGAFSSDPVPSQSVSKKKKSSVATEQHSTTTKHDCKTSLTSQDKTETITNTVIQFGASSKIMQTQSVVEKSSNLVRKRKQLMTTRNYQEIQQSNADMNTNAAIQPETSSDETVRTHGVPETRTNVATKREQPTTTTTRSTTTGTSVIESGDTGSQNPIIAVNSKKLKMSNVGENTKAKSTRTKEPDGQSSTSTTASTSQTQNTRSCNETSIFPCSRCDNGIYITINGSIEKKNPQKFPCSKCQIEFPYEESLTWHQNYCNTEKQLPLEMQDSKFICIICKKIYLDMESIHNHIRLIHTKEYPFKCNDCYMKFSSFNERLEHSVVHNDYIFRCVVCGFNCKHMVSLKVHHQKLHSNSPAPKSYKECTCPNMAEYECKKCKIHFNTKEKLMDHLKNDHAMKKKVINENKLRYNCTKCDSKFAHKQILTLHSQYCKTGKKLPVKSYTDSENITIHQCTVCDKKFKYLSQLHVHIRKYHTLERPFSCKFCPKKFLDHRTLQIHRGIHKICQFCSETFTKRIDIIRHLHENHKI